MLTSIIASLFKPERPQPRTQPLAEKFAAPIPVKNSKAHESARRLAQEMGSKRPLSAHQRIENRRKAMESLEKTNRARDLEKLQIRRWKAGDLYAPHDLSSVEMQKWRKRHKSNMDVFDALAINPLHEYKVSVFRAIVVKRVVPNASILQNYSIMTEYMTTMGRIKHSNETGLRAVNQRRIAKAIRRAIGMGLMPSVHKHPEVLEAEAKDRARKRFGAY